MTARVMPGSGFDQSRETATANRPSPAAPRTGSRLSATSLTGSGTGVSARADLIKYQPAISPAIAKLKRHAPLLGCRLVSTAYLPDAAADRFCRIAEAEPTHRARRSCAVGGEDSFELGDGAAGTDQNRPSQGPADRRRRARRRKMC